MTTLNTICQSTRRRPRAFTLVELLVVIAIMGVMMAMMLPAISACREVASRAQCGQNAGRLVQAMHQYESSQTYYPPAGWNDTPKIVHRPEGHHQGWIIAIMPYLDHQEVYRAFDTSASVYAEQNVSVRGLTFNVLTCPSDAALRGFPFPTSSYAGSYHDVEVPIAEESSGGMVLNTPLQRRQYEDGLAHVLLIGEKRSDAEDLGWLSATRSSLRNTGHRLNTSFVDPLAAGPDATFVGGFGSPHQGGAWLALGDGSVRFVSDQVEPAILQQLGHRSDGKLLSDDSY